MAPAVACSCGAMMGWIGTIGAYGRTSPNERAQPLSASAETVRTMMSKIGFFIGASDIVVQVTEHGVGGGNGLGVHFVGALGLDHADQLFHYVDVGTFQCALD